MAITEQKVWVTSKGTKCNSFEEAQHLEVAEQLERIEAICVDWRGEYFNCAPLTVFLTEDPSARPFVEAINHLYNQNPASKTNAT